jgi:hypothetical protein
MTPEQQKLHDRPDFRNRSYDEMEGERKIVRDVKKGALALRGQTVKRLDGASVSSYLPKFPAEHPDDYRDRVGKATLFNATARTIAGLRGLAMKKNPVLSDDVPEVIRGRKEVRDEATGQVKSPKAEGHAENIDLAGTHLDVFAGEALEDALTDGHCFVLVDMQKSLGEGATLADELKAGLRPYWVRYTKNQALNWRAVSINGQKELGQITFEEKSNEPSGMYGEREVCRYRTFTLETDDSGVRRVKWEVKEKKQNDKGEETFETVEGPGYIRGFSRIPVAVVYGKRTGFLESQPPLLDLALLNVSYFQKKSDRDQSLHKCGNPIPIFPGFDEEKPVIKVGSGLGIITPDKESKPYYMEPEGNALEESREDLKELRGEMAALGLTMIEGRPRVEATATEAVLDFSEESSELENVCRSEQDAFELCLGFHAQYLGQKSGGSVQIGAHLKAMRLTQQQIQQLSNMAAADQLSLLTMWEIMERADALPDTFDAKTEEDRIAKQIERRQKTLGDALLKDFDRGGEGNEE